MAYLRHLVPLLAVVGQAVAQCGGSDPTTINSSGDVPAGCTSFQGDIVISSNAAGVIDLGSIGRIAGSLIMDNNSAVTGLSAGSLQTIDKEFRLTGVTALASMAFGRLSSVDTITWIGLPTMNQLAFGSGVEMANIVDIENTDLTTLTGINLRKAKSIKIANNKYLGDITMKLETVETSLTVTDNGPNVKISLPNLIWANNITIGNVSTYSAPSLEAVNKSMGFRGCKFDTLSQANLTQIGGDLTLLVNDNLNNVSLPALTKIGGGFTIGDNPKLEKITGFSALAAIGGGVDLHGNFTEATLPALTGPNAAKGAVNIQSSVTNFSCSFWDDAKKNSIIGGKEFCRPGISNASSDPSKAKGGSGSGSGSSSGAAKPITVTGASGVLVVVAAIFGML